MTVFPPALQKYQSNPGGPNCDSNIAIKDKVDFGDRFRRQVSAAWGGGYQDFKAIQRVVYVDVSVALEPRLLFDHRANDAVDIGR